MGPAASASQLNQARVHWQGAPRTPPSVRSVAILAARLRTQMPMVVSLLKCPRWYVPQDRPARSELGHAYPN